MSLLVWFLYCTELSLLAMTYSVMASFVQPPLNQSALLNSTATFSCVASNVVAVTYLVNSMAIYAVASLGVSESSPLTSGSQITVNLTIPATSAFNNSQVVCITFLAGTRDDSQPAYLLVLVAAPKASAPPSAPQYLMAAAVGGTYVVLTWHPPMDLGIGGPLYYDVSCQAVSGPNGASDVTSSNITTTDTHVNVTSLSPGTAYNMTVEADNGVPGEERKRSASISVTTNSTSPTPTQTAPPPAPAIAWKVGVVVGVVVAVILLVVVIVVLMYKKTGIVKRCTGIYERLRSTSTTSTNSAQSTGGNSLYIQYPSTENNISSDGMKTPGFVSTPHPATHTHMPSSDGVVVGMLTPSSQEEVSESKPSSDTNTGESETSISNNSHQTTLQHSSTPPSSAVHRNDGSACVPTSEGHDDVRTSPHPLPAEAAPQDETGTPQCRHGPPTAPPLHTYTLVPPENGVVPTAGGVVHIALEMKHADTAQHDV